MTDDTLPETPTAKVTPVKPRKRRNAEPLDEPQYIDLLIATDDKDDYEIIMLNDGEEIPPVGQGFGVNGRFFNLRSNVWYRVPTWLLSTIDNCVLERPIRDTNNRFVGTRPQKRFPYEKFRA